MPEGNDQPVGPASSAAVFPPDPRGLRLGPFWLMPGVTRGNALVLLLTSFSTIGLVTWVNFVTPYLFATLGVPTDRQGELSSILVFLQEAVQILTGGLMGAMSDRHGRRVMIVGGLLLMSAGYVLYPLAWSETSLVLLRGFYAVGMTAASVMVSTAIAEYSQNTSRGRWMGIVGVCNGLGVVVTATVLSRLPQFLEGRGHAPEVALQLSFWIFAAYLVALAAVARLGLAPRRAGQVRSRAGLWQQTLKGLVIARQNPRIALAYATAFASRGDLVILSTFMSLWLIQAGVAEGMTPAEATRRAGMLFGLTQFIALLWSVVMGIILDRVGRLSGVVIAFSLACIGYLTLGQVPDPFGSAMLPAAILAGIGEASAIVAAGTLIGHEAPAASRGVVIGTYGVAGSIGMVVLTFAGGQIYDAVGGGSPFTMMGLVNGAVAVMAVSVRRRSQQAAAEPLPP